jgi:serine/threonine protein kinase
MVFPPLEVEILRSLRHPGICRLREAAVGRDDAFVVLEHIGYGTLLETVGRGLSESTCRAFARDVAGTVAYLHAHGVVHRDLKAQFFLCLFDLILTFL